MRDGKVLSMKRCKTIETKFSKPILALTENVSIAS